MSKKEKSKKLPPELYWEWRCTLEEMKVAKLQTQQMADKQQIHQLEAKCMSFVLREIGRQLSDRKANEKQVHQGYERMLERIQKETGIDIRNCIIDPYTYEVKTEDEIENPVYTGEL